jgi:hypothetical protein
VQNVFLKGGRAINKIFDLCVDLLQVLSKMLGMSYAEVNVWIFCILEPLAFIALVLWIRAQSARIRELQGELKGKKNAR